jgi:cell division protein FtsB
VIVAAFVLDVALHGVSEEAASLIVVLRLWRVFKIIEELSVGAQEQMEELKEKIEDLEKGNRELQAEIYRLETRDTDSHR